MDVDDVSSDEEDDRSAREVDAHEVDVSPDHDVAPEVTGGALQVVPSHELLGGADTASLEEEPSTEVPGATDVLDPSAELDVVDCADDVDAAVEVVVVSDVDEGTHDEDDDEVPALVARVEDVDGRLEVLLATATDEESCDAGRADDTRDEEDPGPRELEPDATAWDELLSPVARSSPASDGRSLGSHPSNVTMTAAVETRRHPMGASPVTRGVVPNAPRRPQQGACAGGVGQGGGLRAPGEGASPPPGRTCGSPAASRSTPAGTPLPPDGPRRPCVCARSSPRGPRPAPRRPAGARAGARRRARADGRLLPEIRPGQTPPARPPPREAPRSHATPRLSWGWGALLNGQHLAQRAGWPPVEASTTRSRPPGARDGHLNRVPPRGGGPLNRASRPPLPPCRSPAA